MTTQVGKVQNLAPEWEPRELEDKRVSSGPLQQVMLALVW